METKGIPVFHRFSRSKRCLPDCLVIGVQKGGTTALFDYLIQHQQVLSPIKKEIWFFNNSRLYNKGVSWYRSFFPLKYYKKRYNTRIGKSSIVIDATANYFEFTESAERIARTLPGVKLILLLRDPVERAFSHYRMAVKRGYEIVGFEEALDLEEQRLAYGQTLPHDYVYQRLGYRKKGEYARLLQPWLSTFDKDQLLVLKSEDLQLKTDETYRRVEDFLGLSPNTDIDFKKVNVGSKGEMNADTRRSLEAHYKKHNEELTELLGGEFTW